MSKPIPEGLWELLPLLFRPHPWHGISVGDQAPDKVTAYIEIVPTDPVKYELDKTTGYLKIDRPQKFSNVYPTLEGREILIAGNQDNVFRRLAMAMGRPELADDERFSSHVARGQHQAELLPPPPAPGGP